MAGLPFGCAPFLRQGKQGKKGKKPRLSTGKKMPAGLPFVPQGKQDPALR